MVGVVDLSGSILRRVNLAMMGCDHGGWAVGIWQWLWPGCDVRVVGGSGFAELKRKNESLFTLLVDLGSEKTKRWRRRGRERENKEIIKNEYLNEAVKKIKPLMLVVL